MFSSENSEPVHVHAAVKRPSKDSTKIWLTRSGGCVLAHNQGNIPERDLRNIEQFVSANHDLICRRWCEATDQDCTFYC